MQMAINMDKLEHTRFITMVTKNLVTIVHARKKFGAYLDLDNHATIKDALLSHLELESQKALHIIRKEYQEIAYDQSDKAREMQKMFFDKAREEVEKDSSSGLVGVNDIGLEYNDDYSEYSN